MIVGQIRPFHLFRDIGRVADLIETAFQDETDEAHLARAEVLTLRLFAPFMTVAGWFVPDVRNAFTGVVWEEDGRIIGNVSFGKGAGDSWVIGNVAVHPEYRGRGIAKAITLAAVEGIRARGGECALLEVRANNGPAYSVYRRLGFTFLDGTLEQRGSLTLRDDDGSFLRPLQIAEWTALLNLMRATIRPEAEQWSPITEKEITSQAIMPSFGGLSWLLAGRRSLLLVAPGPGRLRASVDIELRRPMGPHHAKITIHPDERGRVERELLDALGVWLRPWPGAVTVTSTSQDGPLRDALTERGFTSWRQLDRLILRL